MPNVIANPIRPGQAGLVGGQNYSGGLTDPYGTAVANPTPSKTPYAPPPLLANMGLSGGGQSTAIPQRTSAPMGIGAGAQGLGSNLAHPMPGMTGAGNDNPLNQQPRTTIAPTGNTGSVSGVSTGASSTPGMPPPAQLSQLGLSGGSTPQHFNNTSGGVGGGSMSPGPVSATSPSPSAAPSGWSGFTPPTSQSQPYTPAPSSPLNGNSYQTASMTSAANGTGVSSPGGMKAQSGMPSWLGHATPQQMALLQQNPSALDAYAPGGSATQAANAQGGLGMGANGQPNWQNWGWSSPSGDNAGAFTPFAPGGSQGNMGMQGGPGQQAPTPDPSTQPQNYGLGYGGGPSLTQAAPQPYRVNA